MNGGYVVIVDCGKKRCMPESEYVKNMVNGRRKKIIDSFVKH